MKKDQRRQLAKSDLHPSPMEVPAAHDPVSAERDEPGSHRDLEVIERHNDSRQTRQANHHADRQSMPQGDGRERPDDGARAFFLHPQGDREQPSHSGIDAVVRPEQKQRRPAPGAAHE